MYRTVRACVLWRRIILCAWILGGRGEANFAVLFHVCGFSLGRWGGGLQMWLRKRAIEDWGPGGSGSTYVCVCVCVCVCLCVCVYVCVEKG
jgi:hypothetical protein